MLSRYIQPDHLKYLDSGETTRVNKMNATPQGASGHRAWDSFLELPSRTSVGGYQ